MANYLPGAEPFSLRGSRAAVLLMHGFSGSVSEIRGLGDALHAAGFSIVAPALAGHGLSPNDLAKATREDFFAAAQAGYDEAAKTHERVYIVGLSMGATLGLHLAANNRVAALVTISAPLFMGRFISMSVPLLVRWAPHHHVISNYAAWRGEVIGYKSTPLRSLAVFLSVLKQVRRELPRVHAPLLVVHSTGDQTVPVSNARFIAAHVGSLDKEVRIYQGGRHLLTLPPDLKRVSTDVLGFLERQEARQVLGHPDGTKGA